MHSSDIFGRASVMKGCISRQLDRAMWVSPVMRVGDESAKQTGMLSSNMKLSLAKERALRVTTACLFHLPRGIKSDMINRVSSLLSHRLYGLTRPLAKPISGDNTAFGQ